MAFYNGKKVFSVVKTEGEVDTSGTMFYKYVSSGGTAIPNNGTQVSKIYFNTKMSGPSEYLKNAGLTFIEYGGMKVYPFLFNSNTYEAYAIGEDGAMVIANLATGERKTLLWANNDWASEIIAENFILFDPPVTTINNFQGLPVGIENEKIKALVSFEDNFVNQKEKCSTKDIINNLGVELVSDLEIIDDYASPYRRKLTSIDLPNATIIGESAFQYCESLTSVNIPNATYIDYNAFYYCSALTSIDLPNATSISNYAFQYCESLTTVNLPNATSIGHSAFNSCGALTTVILRSTTVCSLPHNTAFNYTPIETSTTEGFIYVPDELVEDYKVATGWSNYASKIKPISELPTE